MCGIFLSVSATGHTLPNGKIADRLHNRGPDSTATITATYPTNAQADGERLQPTAYVVLHSTVLSLRGSKTVQQPYQDRDGGYTLCWNGEAWSIADERVTGNDTELIHRLLFDALQSVSEDEPVTESGCSIAKALSTVAGPYAFAFLDHTRGQLFFGRDFLGRRSLLIRNTSDGDLIISSVSDDEDAQAGWTEVETDGIYCVDLRTPEDRSARPKAQLFARNTFAANVAPYCLSDRLGPDKKGAQSVIPRLSLSKGLPIDPNVLDEHSPAVAKLENVLRSSLAVRVLNVPVPPPAPNMVVADCESTRLATLFSGGLDCTVLARISHELLPLSYAIDLLNVAFENPRIHKTKSQNGDLANNIYELCPDRITGRASYAELQRICPNRAWRFVAINVPYTEFQDHRELIISLMYPHNTEMDLSIASALYFAARGRGVVSQNVNAPSEPYTTPARVLLSGLGADELFAGYTRHATAFKRNGLDGLLNELELDVSRLGKRNLGRDDRVMSHWGREMRYPYLDEALLTWALNAAVTEKCGFGEADEATAGGAVDSSKLEPGKKVLRCLAWKLGMRDVAREKKRAIQFGARTAKMETGKTKGTHLLN